METKNFRGIVLNKYRSIADFSHAIGWSYRKAYSIVNGTQDPNVDDVRQMAEVLDLQSKDEFISIFFAPLSTLWSNERFEETRLWQKGDL